MQQMEENMRDETLQLFLERQKTPLYPFEEQLRGFCEKLSQQLFAEADARQHPELLALAFWLRRSHIELLLEHFRSLEREGSLRVPRGLVFHIAPGNVETLFVYSWVLSLLVGNVNVVRMPSKESAALALLFAILKRVLAEFEKIAATTLLLSYAHEEEVTRAICAKADVRLIWGGDASIEAIRKIPMKITGKELLFADRYALAAFRASVSLTKEANRLAELFFRDLFWYDQKTCASPRTIFWIGAPAVCREASQSFYLRLQQIAEARKYAIPLNARLSKMAEVYRAALALPITSVHTYGPLTVVDLNAFEPACRTFGGNGLLFSLYLEELGQLAPYIVQKDQTLVHAGFTSQELLHLATQLNGRGLDRLVPVGSALQFGEIWDGYDLLAELTKQVVVDNG